jgi:hypothetical protein
MPGIWIEEHDVGLQRVQQAHGVDAIARLAYQHKFRPQVSQLVAQFRTQQGFVFGNQRGGHGASSIGKCSMACTP